MAPIKFEENIREKLEARSLQPSLDAWQSLEHKLNIDSKKRNKNKFWWFGIAASVIGLLFVLQQTGTFNNTNSNTPILVDTEKDVLNNEIESPLAFEEEQKIVQEESEVLIKPKLNTVSASKTIQKSPVKVSVIARNKDVQKLEPIETPIKDEVINSLVNVTNTSVENKTKVVIVETTNSEIEDLLADANKDLQLSEDKTINTFTVDANALLEDAETEIPPSLRGQLFKAIEKNFKTAKTAVATRNE